VHRPKNGRVFNFVVKIHPEWGRFATPGDSGALVYSMRSPFLERNARIPNYAPVAMIVGGNRKNTYCILDSIKFEHPVSGQLLKFFALDRDVLKYCYSDSDLLLAN
jgi:hypothetical protein